MDRVVHPRGRTLKLHLVDGSSSGVITAELGVSSVRAVVASRTALPDLLRREEATRTGVYLLQGSDPELPERQLVYVGEADRVRKRLAKHDGDETKDFFTRVVLVVLKDDNLTKAHGRYLESRLINAIESAGRVRLVNSRKPIFRGLPDSEIGDMERVLDEIEVLLPVLGFDVLRTTAKDPHMPSKRQLVRSSTQQADLVEQNLFIFREGGTSATAREINDEFVVLKGSLARQSETPSCSQSIHRRREQLLADKRLISQGNGFLQFTTDTPFDTPSGAGAVVYGGSTNGRTNWRHVKTEQSYGDWRKAQLQH